MEDGGDETGERTGDGGIDGDGGAGEAREEEAAGTDGCARSESGGAVISNTARMDTGLDD